LLEGAEREIEEALEFADESFKPVGVTRTAPDTQGGKS